MVCECMGMAEERVPVPVPVLEELREAVRLTVTTEADEKELLREE